MYNPSTWRRIAGKRSYTKKNIYVCIFTPNARMYTKENEYDTVLALTLSEYIPKSIKNERTYRPQTASVKLTVTPRPTS